jgi:hypothetical protein
MYYINYVTGAQSELDEPDLDYPNYLFQLQRLIAEGLKLKDPSIVIKYRWLKKKFAPHLSRIKRNARHSPEIDEDLRDAYQGIPDFDEEV